MSARFRSVLFGNGLSTASSRIFNRGEVEKEEKKELKSSALWDAVVAVTPFYTIFLTLFLCDDDILTYGNSRTAWDYHQMNL